AVPSELDPSASAAATNTFNTSSVAGRFFFGSYSISSPTNGFALETTVGCARCAADQASLHTEIESRALRRRGLLDLSTFSFSYRRSTAPGVTLLTDNSP